MIRLIEDKKIKEVIAESILHDLPEWFGIEEYTKAYIEKSMELPMFAYFNDNKAIGFISLKETSKYALEIEVMGVLKDHRHTGIGSKLFVAAENYAKGLSYSYLHVKTVKQGKYKGYDQTNKFYKKMGFCELEVLPTLWDSCNPCQIFIKYLSK